MSDKGNNDNHSNQLNPNNDAYWESRGYDERPEDCGEKAEEIKGGKDEQNIILRKFHKSILVGQYPTIFFKRRQERNYLQR